MTEESETIDLESFERIFPDLPVGTGSNNELGLLVFDKDSICNQQSPLFSLSHDLLNYIFKRDTRPFPRSIIISCKVAYQSFSQLIHWPNKPFQLISSLVGYYHYTKNSRPIVIDPRNPGKAQAFSLAICLKGDGSFEGTLTKPPKKYFVDKVPVKGTWEIMPCNLPFREKPRVVFESCGLTLPFSHLANPTFPDIADFLRYKIPKAKFDTPILQPQYIEDLMWKRVDGPK